MSVAAYIYIYIYIAYDGYDGKEIFVFVSKKYRTADVFRPIYITLRYTMLR